MLTGIQRSQKRASDLLELELLAAVSHLMWVLETQPEFFAKATNTLFVCFVLLRQGLTM